MERVHPPLPLPAVCTSESHNTTRHTGRHVHHRYPHARRQAPHSRRDRRLGSHHRPRGPCPGDVGGEAVFRRLDLVRRGAQRQCQPGRRGDARHAARDQRGMRAAGDPHRPRAEGRDQPQVDLRPEELLLSGSAAGLSDLAVQAADRRRGKGDDLDRAGSRRQVRGRRGRHRAPASRAGRRQVDPRPAPDAILSSTSTAPASR